MRRRVLIVNVFFDEYGRTGGSPWRVPRGSGHVFLAGAFNPRTIEVRLFSEQTDGHLADPALIGWPDMLVLTGLTSGLDRMLHLAAQAKTLNPRVVTVAGGPAVRALPRFSAARFDHACAGDVEELRSVALGHWGEDAVSPPGDLFPRFELTGRRGRIGYVESSRNCNFSCAFCSLTAEARRYRPYRIDHVRRQIEATGKRLIVFLDNNFYGNNRAWFEERIALLAELRRAGRIDGWAALVTADFFARECNVEAAARAGCISLFSGVESFDPAQLARFAKRQNAALPQLELIRRCLSHGILFQYGIMLDPAFRSLADLWAEVDFILSTPDIPPPSYFTLPIPLPGTPHFRTCVDDGLILPDVRLRDLNGATLTLRPLDPLPQAIAFARDLIGLSGRRARVVEHALRFSMRHARRLSALQQAIAWAQPLLTTLPHVATAPWSTRRPRATRTCFAPTEPLDTVYRPAMLIDPAFREHFRPTRLTDGEGRIAPELAPDFSAPAPHAVPGFDDATWPREEARNSETRIRSGAGRAEPVSRERRRIGAAIEGDPA